MAKVTRLMVDQSGAAERRRIHLREISDDADASLETVGQDLRKARQRKGEDLAQVAAVLKIRKDHLEAIEESRFADLPGRAYSIGFVRSYAEHLGLDYKQCVSRVKAEMVGPVEAEEKILDLAPKERRAPQGSFVFFVLLLIAVVYGGYYVFGTLQNYRFESVLPVPDRLAGQALDSKPAPQAAPIGAAVSSVATAQPQVAAATPPPSAIPAATSGVPAATLLAAPDQEVTSTPPSKPPVPLPSPGLVNAATPEQPSIVGDVGSAATGRVLGAQNKGSRISLRAHKEILVEVVGPGNVVFLRRQLEPGDVYLSPNFVGLKLSASDSGGLELILDGESKGFLGKDGSPAEGLSLNPQDVADRATHG